MALPLLRVKGTPKHHEYVILRLCFLEKSWKNHLQNNPECFVVTNLSARTLQTKICVLCQDSSENSSQGYSAAAVFYSTWQTAVNIVQTTPLYLKMDALDWQIELSILNTAFVLHCFVCVRWGGVEGRQDRCVCGGGPRLDGAKTCKISTWCFEGVTLQSLRVCWV